jgi:allantoinase
MGLPHRIDALRQLLTYVKSQKHVWFCTREELARWYLANHKGHIPGQDAWPPSSSRMQQGDVSESRSA